MNTSIIYEIQKYAKEIKLYKLERFTQLRKPHSYEINLNFTIEYLIKKEEDRLLKIYLLKNKQK
jgi:hypothetical protein